MKMKIKKTKVSGKKKGTQFERTVCVKLSQWVSDGDKKDVFWRTAMSGGRATVHRKKGDLHRQAGDICAVAPEGHVLTERYYFELKSYKSLQVAKFLMEGKGILAKFWVKTCEEAESYGRIPVLIAKQNRLPIMLITTPPDFSGLCLMFPDDLVLRHSLSFANIPDCGVYQFEDVVKAPEMCAPARVKRIRSDV